MRHLKNRLLEKCLISYQFVNLKLFYPECRNFDQNDMRFLDAKEKFIFPISRFRDLRFCLFSISPLPDPDYFCFSYHKLVYRMAFKDGSGSAAELEVLPPLTIGRSGHGCAIIEAENDKKYLVVAGGSCSLEEHSRHVPIN
jgi:hypothetical protein